MKRKINRVGHNTLTISLPSKWAKKYNLQPRDELEVIEEKNRLLISSESQPKKDLGRISFKIGKENYEWSIRKILFSTYESGFDEVEIYTEEHKSIPYIIKVVENILGFEIITQSKDYCLIKNVASPLKESLPDLINKLFIVTIAFSEDVFTAFKNKDAAFLKVVEQQEWTQNKLCMACLRILHESDEVIKEPNLIYFMIETLEAVADDLKYVCQHYYDKRISLDEDSEKMFESYILLLKEMYSLYHHFDIKLHFSLSKDKNQVEYGSNLIENSKKEQRVLISYLQSASLKLYDIGREIFYRDISQSKGVIKNDSFFTSSIK